MSSRENQTAHGFPKGRVAETLRQILSRKIGSSEVESITVVLYSHLLVDDRLSRILYYLLVTDLPEIGASRRDSEEEKKRVEELNKNMREDVWQKASGTMFIRKLEYIEPCLKIWYPHAPAKIRAINSVRNDIFHGRKEAHDVQFQGLSIFSEEGIEKYFVSAQATVMELDKLHEMIDSPHARAEKWARRLQELGQPLL